MDEVLRGPAAPPSANGELIFEEPWQGRVFGMARSLAERGLFEWDDFRQCLIEAIAAWEREAAPGTRYRYYDCFLEALELLLADEGLVTPGEIGERFEAFLTRPLGHDHLKS